jgi:hypothetical protein
MLPKRPRVQQWNWTRDITVDVFVCESDVHDTWDKVEQCYRAQPL